MKMTLKLTTRLAMLLALATGTQALADEGKARTVADGVFTDAQVEAGKSVYDSQCKTCHNMRFYTDALRSWNNQPLLYLWESVLGTMPADNPGSLLYEEYTNVLAYILSEHGFPTGDVAMDPDGNMENITIVAP